MCDTIIVLGNSTEDGSTIFAKNSDREANEPHAICYLPSSTHNNSEQIQCQYISIPQVKETFAVILSKPVWLKIGCEMGANEFGVVMGNEAVFTKEKYEEEGLLGMDLMTISLQRSKTAKEALEIVTDLLEKYGQGGSGHPFDPNYIYHNSFIIADLNEAWILETANKFWVAKKVDNIGTISNGLTIEDNWNRASSGLIENAIKKGWCESKSDFNFSKCYSDPELRIITNCIERQSRTINLLFDKKGQVKVTDIMEILRDHGLKFKEKPFQPSKGTMSSVCMHLNSKAISQTTASYVAHLAKDIHVHWLTGTSAPCLSIFKPFFFENPEALKNIKVPSLKNDNKSLWWRHEILHREAILDYQKRAPIIVKNSQELEQELINEVNDVLNKSDSINKEEFKIKLNEISTKALDQNFSLIKSVYETISKMEIEKSAPKSYIKFWKKLNAEVNIN